MLKKPGFNMYTEYSSHTTAFDQNLTIELDHHL